MIIIIIIIIQLAVHNQAFNCRYSHPIISCIPVFLDSNFFVCFVCFCKRKIKHIHCSCGAGLVCSLGGTVPEYFVLWVI